MKVNKTNEKYNNLSNKRRVIFQYLAHWCYSAAEITGTLLCFFISLLCNIWYNMNMIKAIYNLISVLLYYYLWLKRIIFLTISFLYFIIMHYYNLNLWNVSPSQINSNKAVNSFNVIIVCARKTNVFILYLELITVIKKKNWWLQDKFLFCYDDYKIIEWWFLVSYVYVRF